MFRLTREVRFAIDPRRGIEQLAAPVTNGYAGFPSLMGLAHWLMLRVTLAGELEPSSSYLRNIREIDSIVRRDALPLIIEAVRSGGFASAPEVLRRLFEVLRNAWPPARLDRLALGLCPFVTIALAAEEFPMVRLSQKFEFSASHRLHNPALSEEQNRRTFGKCNNPHGHGHNYELEVTLRGRPDDSGLLIGIPDFERIVAATVIERFDHKNLNAEVPEFASLIPSVENIARVIYRLLQPRLRSDRAELASITVWETAKTWCEYNGEETERRRDGETK